jgi:hypothetical protein
MAEADFLRIGNRLINHHNLRSVGTGHRRYRAIFGTSPLVCSIVWAKILENVPVGGRPQHLLWSLMFLKTYSTEHVLRVTTKVDEKTQRKWIWIFVLLVADMDIVGVSVSKFNLIVH